MKVRLNDVRKSLAWQSDSDRFAVSHLRPDPRVFSRRVFQDALREPAISIDTYEGTDIEKLIRQGRGIVLGIHYPLRHRFIAPRWRRLTYGHE